MSGKRPESAASSQRTPIKWMGILLAVGVAYALLQPVLNDKLGWQLPALENSDSNRPAASSTDERSSESRPSSVPSAASSPSTTDRSLAPSASGQATESLRYGVLRETAADEFLSPAGLRYTRGSAEGHRLKHLQRHLQDDPSRPGKHGVFDGDMEQVIRWIDEGYELAKSGAAGSSRREEDGRTVYEARFSRPLGFVGGRDGRRDNHPDAYHLRLVLEGNEFVTAFPF